MEGFETGNTARTGSPAAAFAAIRATVAAKAASPGLAFRTISSARSTLSRESPFTTFAFRIGKPYRYIVVTGIRDGTTPLSAWKETGTSESKE